MAILICTFKEFTFFLNKKIRQNITTLTKPHRQSFNKICPKCKKPTNQIDSAHKKENPLEQIIEQTIKKYKRIDGKYEINNLQKCIEEITNAHTPIQVIFFFLCQKCHREYDKSLLF